MNPHYAEANKEEKARDYLQVKIGLEWLAEKNLYQVTNGPLTNFEFDLLFKLLAKFETQDNADVSQAFPRGFPRPSKRDLGL